MKCEKCGSNMVRENSTTITGRKLADYSCPDCGNLVHDADEGIALWKALELAGEESRRKEKEISGDSDIEKNKPV